MIRQQDIYEQLGAVYPARRDYALSHFSVSQIAESGQCFRWLPVAGVASIASIAGVADGAGERPLTGCYSIVSAGKRAVVCERDDDHAFTLWCECAADIPYWEVYLTVRDDYDSLYAQLDDADSFTHRASQDFPGMRILRQELFETIASFIISQNNNISRIKKSVAEMCGDSELVKRGFVTVAESASRPAFPDAEQLSERLDAKGFGLGYRLRYMQQLCDDWTGGEYVLLRDSASTISTPEAISMLTEHLGIGAKVASCIALFALHRLDALPRDVWVKRAEQGHGVKWIDSIAGFQQQLVFEEVRRLDE